MKFPTGGDGEGIEQIRSHKPASARLAMQGGVSRFGVNPKPTVTVRMKESARCTLPAAKAVRERVPVRPDSGNT